jgi:hypothetical protein
MKWMPILMVAGLLFAAPIAAHAQDQAKVEQESGNVFGTIKNILLKWLFPIGAAYCFIHGVISKGVKRGEWDMAALCVVGAVALALFPKLLAAIFPDSK